ncbi:MAG: aminotransferase class I/II-fold pyridoxal phosphate-dependent enzyme, partial [Rhodococcus sp. (in: high G+C Gram-positive bacteria)]
GAERAKQTLDNARYLHNSLVAAGVDVHAPSPLPDGTDMVSPIVPVNVRDDLRTVNTWRKLWDAGIFASAAMFPAVARDGALLRLCVQPDHTHTQLDYVVEQMALLLADKSASEIAPSDEVGAVLAAPEPATV